MARTRVRQHVNPLSKKYQTPIEPPSWQEIFLDPTQPLHIDIGSGWGHFLGSMAQIEKNKNFLGLEIRQPLVEKANKLKERLDLPNLYFLFCNANKSLERILTSLPNCELESVTIQFPDPWFKKRHSKRRVVQWGLVATLAEYLVEEGIVFLQSDVEEVTQQMAERFRSHPCFRQQHQTTWLENNPFPPTEREKHTLSQNLPVYRVLLKKHSTSCSNQAKRSE